VKENRIAGLLDFGNGDRSEEEDTAVTLMDGGDSNSPNPCLVFMERIEKIKIQIQIQNKIHIILCGEHLVSHARREAGATTRDKCRRLSNTISYQVGTYSSPPRHFCAKTPFIRCYSTDCARLVHHTLQYHVP
jgi:hypothetical protein